MAIEFKEVTPETRMQHLDVIGNHEKIITKTKNNFGVVILVVILACFIGLFWQKNQYEEKIDEADKKNKQTLKSDI